jgi:MFS family permease
VALDVADRMSDVGRPLVRFVRGRLDEVSGGRRRTRAIVVLALVLGLSTADTATVGASATQLRDAFDIGNAKLGLLVTLTSIVGAFATLPFGVLADRVRRTWTLAAVVGTWGVAMLASAAAGDYTQLLVGRIFLGVVTAAAGPLVASLVGDYFPPSQRGRVWGFVLTGELIGIGFGFTVTGDVATLSWRAAFVVLALPAFALALAVARLPEPARGGSSGHAHADDDAVEATDAQRIARERGSEPDPSLVLHGDIGRLRLVDAARHILRVRTNLVLIFGGALGYYFLAGVQTFGIEFVKDQYGISQVVANMLLLFVGIGAVAGVLAGGRVGDDLVARGLVNGRLWTAAIAGTIATALFVPAIFTRELLVGAVFLLGAGLMLSAQNPPLDAARLDIMPPQLWGRAESVRTFIRANAQALAPLLFGVVADHVFGGGRTGLEWTFAVMLLPLVAGTALVYVGLRTFPQDVATAAASAQEDSDEAEVGRAAA